MILNFPVSHKIVLQGGDLETIFGSLPSGPEFMALRKQLGEELSVGGAVSPKTGHESKSLNKAGEPWLEANR